MGGDQDGVTTAITRPLSVAESFQLLEQEVGGRNEVIQALVSKFIPERAMPEEWNIPGLHEETVRLLNLNLPFSEWAAEEGIADEEIRDRITDASDKLLAVKEAQAGADLMRKVEKSLVLRMIWGMDARQADEGRSFFSAPGGKTRVGERLFPESIQIHSDPADPRAPSLPWGEDGLPQRHRFWIERGRVANLPTDRFWASQKKIAPNPFPSNTLMARWATSADKA